MAVLLPSDQNRFEISFKPKHSKWLQNIISEVNEKLKEIAKLVEEDADSFSQRSEMYFENRPLLMKMVQDLYRSYRSLADRYDIATRALTQTHLICESFNNQSAELPHDMSDTSKHGIYDMDKRLKGMIELLEGVADSFARRAEMYYKHRPKLMKLVDELHKAYQTLAERYDTAALSVNQAYGTISEAFIPQSQPSVSDMSTRVDSSLDHDELQNGAIGSPKNIQLVRRSVTFSEMNSVSEIAGLQKEISKLSDEKKGLKDQIEKETKRANKSEKEVLSLKDVIKNLSSEKEAAQAQCQVYNAQLIHMEDELAKAEKDIKGLADGWSREVQKISSIENSNHSLKRELERLKGEVEPSVVKSEKITWINSKEEFEPWSLQKKQLQQQQQKQQEDNDELILVLRDELEKIKFEAEDAIYLLRREIERLTEQNLSYEIIINELESKNKKYMEKNKRYESEIEFLREKLWIHIGNQERIMLSNEPQLGNYNGKNTLRESFRWSDFFFWMFFGQLRPLKTHLSTFFQSIVRVFLKVYSKYSSKVITKKDDQLKKQLLLLDANESKKVDEMEKNEEKDMDSIQIISQQ